jgi:hypothetical protein
MVALTVRHQHDPAELDTLKGLLAAGLSLSQIGMRMGMTRAAAGSIVHRMKLKGVMVQRPRISRKLKPVRPKLVQLPRSPAPATRIVAVEPPPPPNAVPLIELGDNGCRWPVAGEGVSTLFCNADRDGHRSYCRHHALRSVRVYKPDRVRQTFECDDMASKVSEVWRRACKHQSDFSGFFAPQSVVARSRFKFRLTPA